MPKVSRQAPPKRQATVTKQTQPKKKPELKHEDLVIISDPTSKEKFQVFMVISVLGDQVNVMCQESKTKHTFKRADCYKCVPRPSSLPGRQSQCLMFALKDKPVYQSYKLTQSKKAGYVNIEVRTIGTDERPISFDILVMDDNLLKPPEILQQYKGFLIGKIQKCLDEKAQLVVESKEYQGWVGWGDPNKPPPYIVNQSLEKKFEESKSHSFKYVALEDVKVRYFKNEDSEVLLVISIECNNSPECRLIFEKNKIEIDFFSMTIKGHSLSVITNQHTEHTQNNFDQAKSKCEELCKKDPLMGTVLIQYGFMRYFQQGGGSSSLENLLPGSYLEDNFTVVPSGAVKANVSVRECNSCLPKNINAIFNFVVLSCFFGIILNYLQER